MERERSPGRTRDEREDDGSSELSRLRGRPGRSRLKRKDVDVNESSSVQFSWGKSQHENKLDHKGRERATLEPGQEKEKANFGLSGALNEDSKTGNIYKGVVLKWSEPADAATPTGPGWRLYLFEGEEAVDTLHIHRQSAYLVGSKADIADIVDDDESVDEQHAVIQFKIKTKPPPPGSLDPPKKFIKPYIMDLESKNGTFLNKEKIEPARYYELLPKDSLSFGTSPREYVVMKAKKLK